MSKTLKKLTVLLMVTLAVAGGILWGLSATANAQSSDEAALRAEVAANSEQFVMALNTGDKELFDSMWLQTDETTRFNSSQPFRIEGWSDVRQTYAGILGLPPGASSSMLDNSASTSSETTWPSLLGTLSRIFGRREGRGEP